MNQRSMKYVDVLGSKMAYVDEGAWKEGAPVVVFLHGNPTSSYLWRNVIPHVSPQLRCVAPDLIGFGDSDKPEIGYRVEDHARYLQAFIEALNLTDVILVLHDWGSALGLDWARRHPAQVQGLALMEFLPPMPTWLDLGEQPYEFFKAFRDPAIGRSLLIDNNAFIEQGLPGGIVRELSSDEMEEYRRPFSTPQNREPIYRFPNELPIAGTPTDVYAMAVAYHEWLLATETPKIFFHAAPGIFIPPARAEFYRSHLKSCRTVDLGQGLHYLQEDHPDTIGQEIAAWLQTLR
ncbi:haloalkane dehalogenase [Pseudomonas gingeri]|uniref:haloalkane dehalogenase n=1 Tax=Pseudomonas gingeri TaxID=117681 RepID=UPI0015A1607D|nr:haloalkane dehalogenase [Pseudomonas gingeri]NWD73144.1 haloalkane dehalogenase [Pseudomonas gingeri]